MGAGTAARVLGPPPGVASGAGVCDEGAAGAALVGAKGWVTEPRPTDTAAAVTMAAAPPPTAIRDRRVSLVSDAALWLGWSARVFGVRLMSSCCWASLKAS